MIRRPPRSTRTDTLFPYTTLFRSLLARGERVIGLDSFTDYYDVALKKARTARLADHFNFRLIDGDIASPGLVSELVEANGIRRIVHLAAQAGVRYRLERSEERRVGKECVSTC